MGPESGGPWNPAMENRADLDSVQRIQSRWSLRGPLEEIESGPWTRGPTGRLPAPSDGHGARVLGGGRSRPGLVGVSCTAGRLHRLHHSRGDVTTERPAPSTSTDSAPSLSAAMSRVGRSQRRRRDPVAYWSAETRAGPGHRRKLSVRHCLRRDRREGGGGAGWWRRREPELRPDP
jgi:hypothetical protein